MPLYAVTPQSFPDDYVPSPCAMTNVCESFAAHEISRAGTQMQGYSMMRQGWIDSHWDELMTAAKPYCTKLATCYATPGNTNMFCDDVVLTLMMGICDRWPAKSDDHDQCFLLMRAYASGVDQRSYANYLESQKCARANAPANQPLRKLDLKIVPESVPSDFKGKIVMYAFDHETHVPMQAYIQVGDEILYARDAPDGRPATAYWLPWKAKLVRVRNASGHEDVTPPMVTITRDGYETIKFPMPMTITKVTAQISPSADKLKRGAKNNVTINLHDAKGKPAEGVVYAGERQIGFANEPVSIEWKKGEKRPEIWVKSPFDSFSDVVVAPAER